MGGVEEQHVVAAFIKVDVEGYEARSFEARVLCSTHRYLRAVNTEGQMPTDIAPLLRAGFAQFEYDPFPD
jgi:hypothetical protein